MFHTRLFLTARPLRPFSRLVFHTRLVQTVQPLRPFTVFHTRLVQAKAAAERVAAVEEAAEIAAVAAREQRAAHEDVVQALREEHVTGTRTVSLHPRG